MKHLIEFPLENGETILVEVDEPEASGLVPVARPGEIAAKATQTFESAMDQIKPLASGIVQKLRALSEPADEITVEFGLKLTASAGIYLAAGVGGEANYKVTLKWIQR